MTQRHAYGADLAGWTYTCNDNNLLQLHGGVELTFWTEQAGGTRHTDLSDDPDAATPLSTIRSSDGTTGYPLGQIPRFYGPPGVLAMWVSADSGPRTLIIATGIATALATTQTQLDRLDAQLQAHLSTTNPHATALGQLCDVDTTTAQPGQALIKNPGGGWVPATIDGATGLVTLTDPQTLTATKTLTPAGDSPALVITANPTHTADLLTIHNGTGQPTIRITPDGLQHLTAPTPAATPLHVTAARAQTANLQEWCDPHQVATAWVNPAGHIRAPNLGHTLLWTIPTAAARPAPVYNDTGVTLTIRTIRATAPTPAAQPITVDITNSAGASIFATPTDRPTIPTGHTTSGRATAIGTTSWPDGDALTPTINQTEPNGTDAPALTVQILAY